MHQCDCACHPHNGLEVTQKRWQFGVIQLAGREQPCFCCWCHYDGDRDPVGDFWDLCG